ncbi:oligopeptide ABC transporter substrate-binding protein OppA [Marinomonas mediterranea]|uniref:ABC transporter substrate-binding protein n=1 Tax=Marinomonas mediterranea TaxID=119864 RepID=UPI00234BEB31|nr:ABC transporter substrate-binding protein [Marinomonas mediterranea]WCN15299.1 oligopeptide ABC transporter substrate-binding protein OppA [Marinomonas mediterranea]
MKLKQSLIASAVLAAALGASYVQAAKVPDGVKLAAVQEIVKGGESEPATLDQQKLQGTPGSLRGRDLFEGLFNEDGDGNLIPGVATSYDANEDNTVYTFHLRDDAKWSNGDSVTAHDFVFAFQRLVDPKTAADYAWFAELPGMINATDIINGKKPATELGVEATDDYTFVVRLEKPNAYFPKMTIHNTLFPAPKKVIEKWGDDWTKQDHIVFNGAYVLDQWNVNEKMVLVRNPMYWNDKETVINKVTYLPISDVSVEFKRYQAGEMDLTSYQGIPTNRYKQLMKDTPDEVHITPQLGTYYYLFNTTKAPFDDVRVRKALSYSIDRDIITKFVTGTGEVPSYGFTPEIINGFDPVTPEYAKWSQAERNKQAKALLAEAGFGPSNPLKFPLLYNTNDQHKKIAVAITSMWKKNIGVTATLENQEWKTYLDSRNTQNFSVARAGWIGDYNEASTFLQILTTTAGSNDGKYSNVKYDKLMNAASSMQDPSENYTKAENVLINQDMAVAPIYTYVTKRLVKPYVGGYMPNPEDNTYTRDQYIIAH